MQLRAGAQQAEEVMKPGAIRLMVFLGTVLTAFPATAFAEGSNCSARRFVLWGDGKHDDTAALNAWFRGDPVVWGETGRGIGSQIAGHVFRLTSPVYIPSGTGRRIEHFEFVWPERQEVVAGGVIAAGADPDRAPVATGLTKVGAGPNEGVPFPSPTPKPATPEGRSDCLVS